MINNTVISHNRIYSNGAGEKEGWPTFPDSTKYAINIEDTNIENVRISDNYIYDGANSILISGARNSTIENNYFMNFRTSAVSIYGPVEIMHFNNNKVYDSAGIINTIFRISDGRRYIYANNNIAINSGNMIVRGGSTFIGSGNLINNRYFKVESEKGIIDNLIFDEEPNLFNVFTNNELIGIFTNAQINLPEPKALGGDTRIDVKEGSRGVKLNIEDDMRRVEPYVNSENHGLIMNGGRVYIRGINQDVELKFINCTFSDIYDINLEAFGNVQAQQYRVSFEDCKFNFSGNSQNFFKANVSGSVKSDFVFDFLDCDIVINSTNNDEHSIFVAYSGRTVGLEINLTNVRINTEKAEGEIELLKTGVYLSEATHVINAKNLDVTGPLTKSQDGYVINNL